MDSAVRQDARRICLWLWLILLTAMALRLVALSSDAYLRLDWSAGLLTDEGFYVHNARNVALYGHARTDDFNNMLLSPVFHVVHVGVFELFGVGIVQARSVSVISSILTLWLFWAALRRMFDERVALTAVAILALDHTNLLYNRMALLDTPAAFLAVAAFYAFVRGSETDPESEIRNPKSEIRKRNWLFLCGILLGLTITNRMLAAYLLPVPFVAAWTFRDRRVAWPIAAGLVATLAAYFAAWYWPNHVELAAMSRYYRTNQIQPRSVAHLLENIQHAFVGDFRGLSPYLFRHTPVVYLLGGGWVVGSLGRCAAGRRERTSSTLNIQHSALVYLTAWFVLGWVLLAVISYSPSRYYVTLYPAMAALAAVAVWRLPGWLERAHKDSLAATWVPAAVVAFAAFHGALSVVHYGGVLSRTGTTIALYGTAVLAFIAALLAIRVGKQRLSTLPVMPLLAVSWAACNMAWLTSWARGIEYTQVSMSRWIGQSLPPGSVVIGDLAPGLTLENRLAAIHVQPGLANDRRPVERFQGAPRYIAILDGRWKEHYWLQNYSKLVSPERRVRLARVLRWDVGIYVVDMPPERTP